MTQPAFALARFCNLDVEQTDAGHATGTVRVDLDQHGNPHGVLHGGVVFTAVDTTMGAATYSVLQPGETCATIEVQLRFLRPVTGGDVHIDTRVEHRGRKVVHLQSRVCDDDGRLVALASGSYAVLGA